MKIELSKKLPARELIQILGNNIKDICKKKKSLSMGEDPSWGNSFTLLYIQKRHGYIKTFGKNILAILRFMGEKISFGEVNIGNGLNFGIGHDWEMDFQICYNTKQGLDDLVNEIFVDAEIPSTSPKSYFKHVSPQKYPVYNDIKERLLKL